jgi:hypothetical protein
MATTATQTRPIQADQAVFTCLHSGPGQGYHVIAASQGLSPEESKEIATHAPSINGLCNEGDDGLGVLFWTLPTGRRCVLYSSYKGKDPSGRGGWRAYTQAIVLTPEDFRRFDNNAFNVIRAAGQAEALISDLKLNNVIPPLSLAAWTERELGGLNHAGETIGPDRLCHLAQRLYGNEALVLSSENDLLELVESLLLLIPVPRRPEVSFSAGVKFLITRGLRLTAFCGDAQGVRLMVHGHPMSFEDMVKAPTELEVPSGPWFLAASDMLRKDQAEAFAELSTDRFSESDVPAIDRIGAALLSLRDLEKASIAELLDAAMQALVADDRSPLDQSIQDRIIDVCRSRLSFFIRQAETTQLDMLWGRLLVLLQRSPAAAAFALPLCFAVIDRLSRLAPIDAMGLLLALHEADSPIPTGSDKDLVNLKSDMFQRFNASLDDLSDQDRRCLRELLMRWIGLVSEDEGAAQLLTAIGEKRDAMPNADGSTAPPSVVPHLK